ncbi:hypothetical protein RHSIM_Rhsim10G0083500 [Rhododendron simsii]|uniref:Uncharacterized protein n=1 Tax=Rhododendron simsii TaxID=118357 RepID=A0A834G9U9_RHOSS|nr:hypothetical protein RHSIM_Rhsim10G0083500 [Rhododendron simsii]
MGNTSPTKTLADVHADVYSSSAADDVHSSSPRRRPQAETPPTPARRPRRRPLLLPPTIDPHGSPLVLSPTIDPHPQWYHCCFSSNSDCLCPVRINFSSRDKLAVKMIELLFNDAIKVDRLDPDGKKFDKVSCIEAQSEEKDMHIQLDVNTEVYPICVGEKFRMALAPTLNLDGSAVTSYLSL